MCWLFCRKCKKRNVFREVFYDGRTVSLLQARAGFIGKGYPSLMFEDLEIIGSFFVGFLRPSVHIGSVIRFPSTGKQCF